jgi:hypothetical protein
MKGKSGRSEEKLF